MPYLHWDIDDWRRRRETVAQISPRKDVPGRHSDERLLASYLTKDRPSLHLRRTLDQFYYHTLQNTMKRDSDQVITRYQDKQRLEHKVITMVDQLWLWVLDSTRTQPHTVISCFPEVGNADEAQIKIVQGLDPESKTSVLEQVKHHLLAEPHAIRTTLDLAGLIAATCSRIYLDPGSTLNVSDGCVDWSLQFSELYQTEISAIVSFCEFSQSGRAHNLLGRRGNQKV